MRKILINWNCFSLNFLSHVRLCLANVQNIEVPEKEKMVDVPRFELGASSMPRKRASKLRHTPNIQASSSVHLRRMDGSGRQVKMIGGPIIPQKLLKDIRGALEGMEAPFLRYIEKELELVWLEEEDSRLGMTRFECDHNEIYRRKRLSLPPGKITIGINPKLKNDEAMFLHTLAHEILHAVGLLDHGGSHSEIVSTVAPAPKLNESPVLRSMREDVLSSLPERQWICGNCGHSWQRRRVTRPVRCPKCARPFSTSGK